MTVDLAVQTALIRQAADVLDDARTVLVTGAAGGHERCPLTDLSLGDSALGREVVAGATRRVLQAAEVAHRLAEMVTQTASALRNTATAFEAAESSQVLAPR